MALMFACRTYPWVILSAIWKWLNSLQLYVNANNVFTITSYKGLDPEVNLGGIDPGVDYRWSNYPHTRTIMVGAKINF